MLVLGDGMADWLAYGLEDAYAEQPDMGVIRKHKTVSGLIRYQPKGDPADWAAAAKGILATEKPDAIVVMLGLNDRIPIREPAIEKSDGKPADKKTDKKDARAKPDPSPTPNPAKPRCRRQARRQGGRHRTAAGRCRRQWRHAADRSRRTKARARRTASMISARIAGSSSTPRKSKR